MKEQKTAAAAAATTGVVERRSAEARAAERPQVAGEQRSFGVFVAKLFFGNVFSKKYI